MITATFPAPRGSAGVGCFRGQEEKAGCYESLCLVQTLPDFKDGDEKQRSRFLLVQQLSYTALLGSGSSEPGNPSLVSASSACGLWDTFVPSDRSCLASDRLSSQMGNIKVVHLSPSTKYTKHSSALASCM